MNPEEIIIIIRDIFDKAGYSIEFSNVDIDLKDKAFTVKGNTKEIIEKIIEDIPKHTPADEIKQQLRDKWL